MTLNHVNDLEIKPEKEDTTNHRVNKVTISKQTAMDTITENDEDGALEDDSAEIVEEVEADYKIGKVIKKQKHCKIQQKEIIENNSISNDMSDISCKMTNLNIDNSKSMPYENIYKKQKTTTNTDKCLKEKQKRRSLEEIIAVHKQKTANSKTIKTIDLSEIVSSKPGTTSNVRKFKGIEPSLPINKVSIKDVKKESNENKIEKHKEENSILNKNIVYDALFIRVKECIKQWLTLETFVYLYGEDKIKQILNEKKLDEYFDKLKITELQTSQKIKYFEICKRLHMRELAEEKFDKSVLDQKLNPLPDYKKLKEESKDMNLKVKSFYCGLLYEKANSNFPTSSKSNKDNDNSEVEGPPAVLPLVDASSQNALRRKVFLNSVNRM